MSQVYFTADTHFNHRAMVERQWRPQYENLKAMNDDLVERWNATVRPEDTVWHLGDVGMGPVEQWAPYVRQLNGTVHLISGNHDRCWSAERNGHLWQEEYLKAGFATIQTMARRRVEGQSVLLSHFPYEGDHVDPDRYSQYRLPDEGLWLLHGHVHTEWKRKGYQINVGVDVNDFRPVSLDEVIEMMKEYADDRRGN